MKHALIGLAALAVGLPVLAALATLNGQTTGGLPARYVPWMHAGRRIHTSTQNTAGHTPSPSARATLEPPRRPPVPRPRPRVPARRLRPSPSGLGGPLSPRPRRAAKATDLRLSLAAPRSVRPRSGFTYALRLANRGPGTPSAITVRTLLPDGVFRTGSALPDGVGGYAGGRDATLVLGGLPPGRSVTARFRVRVRARARGDLVARSRIIYTGGMRDRRPADNTAAVTTRVER